MEWVVCLVALLASALTFFSGFGLGTLLMPAFALFYPIEVAVASTAVVHLLNGLFKVALVGRHARRDVVLRFGLPAIVAAAVGASLLNQLSDATPVATWQLGDLSASIHPAKAVVGILLVALTLLELSPAFQAVAVAPTWLPLGGMLSGFLGGVSGMQGALRSAFLIRLGMSKEAFVGTGALVAAMVDISRLGFYGRHLTADRASLDVPLLAGAVVCALAGALLGNRYLHKVTLERVQQIVAVALVLAGLGLATGVL